MSVKGNSKDGSIMTTKGLKDIASQDIYHLHRPVKSAANYSSGVELKVCHGSLMSFTLFKDSTSLYPPNGDAAVAVSCDDF
jgi:hypothetical protein